MTCNKSEIRVQLIDEHVGAALRISTSAFTPNFDKFVSNCIQQYHCRINVVSAGDDAYVIFMCLKSYFKGTCVDVEVWPLSGPSKQLQFQPFM